jgi:hypothetical protein
MRKDVLADSGAEAYWLDVAIRELEEISGTDERRAAMEVELRGLQKRSLKSMGSFPIEIDVTEDREKISKVFQNGPLSKCLLMFAQLERSPDPEQLRKDALESREAAPLMAMLSTAYIDERGRPTKSVAVRRTIAANDICARLHPTPTGRLHQRCSPTDRAD